MKQCLQILVIVHSLFFIGNSVNHWKYNVLEIEKTQHVL